MICRLLEAHQLKSEEMHRQQLGRQQAELQRTIETTIAQHCHPLSTAIAQEMTTRIQGISEVQAQITELRNTFEAFSTSSIPPSRAGGNRTDKIVIGGFGLKSKYGAIALVEKIIEGKSCDPQIIMDRVSFTPTIIPIKFSSSNYAEEFVREHSRNQ